MDKVDQLLRCEADALDDGRMCRQDALYEVRPLDSLDRDELAMRVCDEDLADCVLMMLASNRPVQVRFMSDVVQRWWPFRCDCAERGVPVALGCDEQCACRECHATHVEATDNRCCRRSATLRLR